MFVYAIYFGFAEIRALNSNLTLEEIRAKEARLLKEVNPFDSHVRIPRL